ncbi:tetratricopeptide repeat protein [candidate division TA06 bacterium]|uniref:Tetratricopeptide repeat protein n=1 Tax=candidate division TA06 bacterium TaxID=2250710 RepID=A0A933ICQ7_UNCT6|nr:tetratricopeptide repeat protein [candidate division TA06 bacterium]
MKNFKEIFIKNWRWRLVFASVVLLVLTLSIIPASDPDLWIILSTGRFIAETGQIPAIDAWSYTALGEPWIMHEWLASLLFYGLYSFAGINGIILFKALLLVIIFAAVLLLMRKKKVSPIIALLTAGLAAAAAQIGFAERIQIFTFAALIGLVWLLELFRQNQVSSKIFLLVIGAGFAVWANLHLGLVFGLFLLAVSCLDEILAGFSGKGWKKFNLLLFGATIAALVTAVNPYGFRLLFEALKYLIDPETRKFAVLIGQTISEYGPLLSPIISQHPFVLYGIIWMGFSGLGLGLNWRKVKISEAVVWLILAALTLKASRYLSFLVLLTMAPTAVHWHQAAASFFQKRRLRQPVASGLKNAALATVCVMGALVIGYIFHFGWNSGRGRWERAGWGWKPRVFSEKAAAFLKTSGDNSPAFNSYRLGGFLLWHRAPVFIDGRLSPYRKILSDYNKIMLGNLNLLDKYKVDWLILDYPETGQTSRLHQILSKCPDWALVFWDDVCLIYARRCGKQRDLIAKYEYRYVNPAAPDLEIAPDKFLPEIERRLREDQNLATPHLIAYNYYFYRQDWRMAEQCLMAGLKIDPDEGSLYNNLGNVWRTKGRLEEAIAAYRRAAKLDPNLSEAYCNWGYLMESRRFYEKAKKLYLTATKVAPSDPWPYNRLGIIEMKRGNRQKAVEYWRKGAAIDPASEAAKNLKNAGW